MNAKKVALVVACVVVIVVAVVLIARQLTGERPIPKEVQKRTETWYCTAEDKPVKITVADLVDNPVDERGYRKCPHCGKQALVRSMKCPWCGAIIPMPPENPDPFAKSPSTWKCPKCGKDAFSPAAPAPK